MSWRILCADRDTGNLQPHPLPLEGEGSVCEVRLRRVAGSSALLVEVSTAESVVRRAEVVMGDREDVRLRITIGKGGIELAAPSETPILYLPHQPEGGPILHPFLPAAEPKSLDLALLIDGTTLWLDRPGDESASSSSPVRLGRLLDHQEAWNRHVDQLVGFCASLIDLCPDHRTAVLAFGDDPLTHVAASDLHQQRRYRIFPEESGQRALRRLEPERIREALLAIPATSGGDFVDALADALHECAALAWREDSRRLLVVTGDSPGYSLLNRPPLGANAVPRRHDLESERVRLQRRRVELVCIYHRLSREARFRDLEPQAKMLSYAEDQYLRLASRPEYFFRAEAFSKERAMAALRPVGPLAYGAAPGHLLE